MQTGEYHFVTDSKNALFTDDDLVQSKADAARLAVGDVSAGHLAERVESEGGVVNRALRGVRLIRDLRLHRTVAPRIAVPRQAGGIIAAVDGAAGRHISDAAQHILAAIVIGIVIRGAGRVGLVVILARRDAVVGELTLRIVRCAAAVHHRVAVIIIIGLRRGPPHQVVAERRFQRASARGGRDIICARAFAYCSAIALLGLVQAARAIIEIDFAQLVIAAFIIAAFIIITPVIVVITGLILRRRNANAVGDCRPPSTSSGQACRYLGG